MVRYLVVVLSLLLAAPTGVAAKSHPAKATEMVRLPGHVLPALASAVPVEPGALKDKTARDKEPLTLTLVLKRDDQVGFERYLRDVYDPEAKIYRHFLSQKEIAKKFGPSRAAYDTVLNYLRKSGFELVDGSANRLTLTVRGTRARAERTFAVHIADYEMGERRFFANTGDPALPEGVAAHIASVSGLSSLATPQPAGKEVQFYASYALCHVVAVFNVDVWANKEEAKIWAAYWKAYKKCVNSVATATGHGKPYGNDPPPPAWQGVDGTGQKVGVAAFDTFHMSDVQDYIDFMGFPANQIDRVSQVHVNGGAGPTPGPNQVEALLDITAVMAIAPGAQIVVYDAPFTGRATSYQAVFNAMLNDGVTIISNSYASCENEVSDAELIGIDLTLQTAAASGISVFNGSGDTGSTCLNGSPLTAAVPASSPHATAVGGTSLTLGPGFTHKSETWWDGTDDAPPTGQGGFGTSRFFSRPGYQDGLHAGPMRLLPDVGVNADPARGLVICAKDKGGCPTASLYGGTSSAAPIWAAFTALLNQSQGFNLGFLNPLVYPLAGTDAFYDAASMGTDFAHVGLGSPNLARLHQRLTSQTPGAVSPDVSVVRPVGPGNAVLPPDAGVAPRIPADGATEAHVVVRLADANGNPVDGKSVLLTPNPAGSVITDPPVGVSGAADGAVAFKITDATPELLTFTATDATDGVVLSETATIEFTVPPATSAGIVANPTPVAADGVTATTITVTLQDVLGRPTPGKLIKIDQGNGHSAISGPNPAVTNGNGQIQFTATNVITETVTYKATDVTDGNLPVPNPPSVSFTNGIGASCSVSLPTVVSGAPFAYTSFVTGFPLSSSNCLNPAGMAFDASGNLYVSTYSSNNARGGIYKFDSLGGTAGNENRLNAAPYPSGTCASQLAFGKDGRLYLARQFCGSGGDVVEVSTTTGAVLRTLATLSCATGLATDPLSGDLFVSQSCPPPAGTNNITRIHNPAAASPTLSTYSSPGISGDLNFGSDGTLYLESLLFTQNQQFITRIAGTNAPNAGAIIYLTSPTPFSAWGVLPAFNPNDPSAPSFLFITRGSTLTRLDLTTAPPTQTDVLQNGSNIAYIVAGPDGCAYATLTDRIIRITSADGSCNFANGSPLPSLGLTPTTVSPSPTQGSSQSLLATLHNVDPLAGHPIFFQVAGANSQIKMVRTDANGQAMLTYTGAFAGRDTILASADVANATLTSNPAQFTWNAGPHVTFATLNPSPTAGTLGQPVDVKASLTDISLASPAPVVGEVVHFALDGAQCVGMTNATGIATCQLVPNTVGMGALTAAFAGTNQLVPATASIGFNVMAPAAPDNRAPDCSGVTAQPPTLWPPNHRLVPISIAGVVDPDSDPVAIAIRSIRQDEPVNGLGDGDTAPDGFGVGSAAAQVRAERAGNRNGRVYHIGFEAGDGKGAACTGTVKVGVPHNQKKTPIDDGPLYDSTVP